MYIRQLSLYYKEGGKNYVKKHFLDNSSHNFGSNSFYGGYTENSMLRGSYNPVAIINKWWGMYFTSSFLFFFRENNIFFIKKGGDFMAKNQFYHSGMPNDFDGNCDTCPFWRVIENRMKCQETDQDVSWYVTHDKLNRNCPYITKWKEKTKWRGK